MLRRPRTRPQTLALCGGLLLAAGLAWQAVYRDSLFRAATTLVPGERYAVDVTLEQSEFDLDFSSDSRYVLVVSSLGDASRKYTVSLQAEPIPDVTTLPARRIGPSLNSKPAATVLAADAAVAARSGSNERRNVGRPGNDDRHKGRLEAYPTSAGGRLEAYPTAGQRDFYLHVTDGSLDDPKQYVRVAGRVIAEGRGVRVYLDRQQHPRELASGVAEEIVRLLDEEIIPNLRQSLGECRDVDGDGKFAILLTPWLGRLQGGRTSVGGFVRGSDFDAKRGPPFSNNGDMLYLNSSVQPGPHLRTLLTHEFTHAVCFSERCFSGRHRQPLVDEEDWLNEAIAHLAENGISPVERAGDAAAASGSRSWSNLDYRISRFLSAPQQHPLVVGDYYRAGLWRDHGCRGATFLFLRWCTDQFGEDLPRRLVRSPVSGTRNLEQATGLKFEELYRRWSLALLESNEVAPETGVATETKVDASYASLDLRGPLARWGLAGPRSDLWDLDGPPQSIELAGTASAFIELACPSDSHALAARRVRVKAAPGTKLQLSLIKRPADWPRLRLETHWHETTLAEVEAAERPDYDPSNPSGAPSDRSLCLTIVGDSGSPLIVEMIACERNFDDTKQSLCYHGEDLIARRLPTHAKIAASRRAKPAAVSPVGRYELPISPRSEASGTWVIKVVARDTQGRRVSAWTTLDPSSSPPPKFEIADSTRNTPERNQPR